MITRFLKEALHLEHPYEFRDPREGKIVEASPIVGTPSAVLVLLAPTPDPMDLKVLLTVRGHEVEHHKGQISFPGGRTDPQDLAAPDPVIETALREAEEEAGIQRHWVEVFGELPSLSTMITGFKVHPVVAMLGPRIEDVEMKVQASEVAEVFWVSFKELTAPGVFRKEPMGSGRFFTPVYQVGPHRIWGATGAMLQNLIERLVQVGFFNQSSAQAKKLT